MNSTFFFKNKSSLTKKDFKMFSLIPQHETLRFSGNYRDQTTSRDLGFQVSQRLETPLEANCCLLRRPSSFFFGNIFHLKKGRPIQPRSMVSEWLNGIATNGKYAARGVDKAAARQTLAVFSILPKQS